MDLTLRLYPEEKKEKKTDRHFNHFLWTSYLSQNESFASEVPFV